MADPPSPHARKERHLAYLASWKPVARRNLRLAVLLGGVAGLAVVAQAWLTARILALALFDRQPLAALALELAALPAVFLIRFGAGWGGERAGFAAAIEVMRQMRRALLERIEGIGPSGLVDQATGTIVATIAEGVRAVEPYFSRYLPASAQMAILPLAILLVVAPIDWLSALIFLVTAPLIPLFMVLIGKGAEALNQRQWLRLTRMSGHFLDAVQGLATLQAFGAGRRMVAQVAARAEAYRRDTMAVLRLAFLSALTLEFFATVSIAMVAVLVGFRLLWGEISYFQGMFVLLLAPEFYLPLRAMGAAYHARMEAAGAAERIVALIELPELAAGAGAGRVDAAHGIAIRFEDVHLVHPDGRLALDGVSFSIAAGETVAFAGPSGSGKSSIQALLLGFVRPSAGRILINEVPLEQLEPAAWRRQIAFIPQRPKLFAATIRSNIALGAAAPDDARLALAVSRAALAEVVAALPDGLETVVGDGGRSLSGGEAHRLALARAFYRDAPLVLLDEPTAHLDADSEALIHAALRRLRPGRTVLIVAHRRASLELADRVIMLDDGRIRAGAPDAAGARSDPAAAGQVA